MKNSLAMQRMLHRFPVARIFEDRTEAPLLAYPREAQLQCTCRECGRQQFEPISLLIRDGRLGGLTPSDVGKVLECSRSSCRSHDFDIVVTMPGQDGS